MSEINSVCDYSVESNNESDVTSDSESTDEKSDEDVPLLQARWFPVSIINPPPSPPRFQFMSNSKIDIGLGDNPDILSYLRLFFDDKFFEMLMNEKKIYGLKHDLNWESRNNDEIFFSLP